MKRESSRGQLHQRVLDKGLDIVKSFYNLSQVVYLAWLVILFIFWLQRLISVTSLRMIWHGLLFFVFFWLKCLISVTSLRMI